MWPEASSEMGGMRAMAAWCGSARSLHRRPQSRGWLTSPYRRYNGKYGCSKSAAFRGRTVPATKRNQRLVYGGHSNRTTPYCWSPFTGTSKTQPPGGQEESARRSATVFALTGMPSSTSTGVCPEQPPRHRRTSSRVLGVYFIVLSASTIIGGKRRRHPAAWRYGLGCAVSAQSSTSVRP